ncbi:MAG TPA: FAD/NAD(P)-binding oxidoreductase, partial [Atopostipes sp.]|nr:FAD/NAD(P)-binding oxidoreductase [Atopostipes sp.]
MFNVVKDVKDKSYKYVLIGGGMGSGFATLGIREHDKEGSILIVSREQFVPYERPALTKKLWRDEEFTVEDIQIGVEEEDNVDFAPERDVVEISPKDKTVTLENGAVVSYEKLLLSTGGEPRTIEGPKDENVFAFREEDDYLKLRNLSQKNQHVIIVGGGYIGSELADSLAQNDTKVTMVFPQSQLGEGMFPDELLAEYNALFEDRGITLMNGKEAKRYRRNGAELVLELEDGTEVTGDAIVIGLGVEPRIELAKKAGLETSDDGVLVNERLETSEPDIHAAGDIATYPDQILGRQRIEHVDHARNSGKQVGEIMAGGKEAYTHTPYFY